MESASDGQVIREVLAGDRQRFSVLVDRHGRALLGFLERRTGPEDSRELFQETLVQAFEGLGRLREPERLRSWMISIAHNLLRKARRGPVTLSLDAANGPAADALRIAPAPSAAEAEEERQRMARAFDRLPERQREVFELRALTGLTHAEIASELGIREDNARANYYQALRKLRAELEDES